jgi:Helicase conserved C-terminal domain
VSDGVTAILGEAARFQRDLYLYVRVAREADGLSLTGRGYVSRPALRRVRALLLAADGQSATEPDADLPEIEDGRLFFLRRLLERLGLLRGDAVDGGRAQRLVARPPDQIAAWFERPLAERLRICARVWTAGGWWPDALDQRAAIVGVMAPAAPRIALARRRLIESLAAMRPGEMGAIPDTAAPGRSASKSRGARIRRTTPPPEMDANTVRASLTGPLAWLGFVRRADARSATFIAEAVCGALAPSADGEMAEAHGQVTIQPDLSIVAYPPLTARLLAALDLYAELERLERVARYKLSRAALARSGHSSWEAGALAEQVERLTGTALPDNVRVTLRDWQRQGERLRAIESASVLEVEDAELLDALLADRRARGWIERRLGATAALIAPGHVADVSAWLLRHGELPATLNGPAAWPKSP